MPEGKGQKDDVPDMLHGLRHSHPEERSSLRWKILGAPSCEFDQNLKLKQYPSTK